MPALSLEYTLNLITTTLQNLARGNLSPALFNELTQLCASDTPDSIQNLINAVREMRELIITGARSQYDLRERMKELSCLYDIKIITEDYKRSLHELFTEVAQRLPAAMRYPEIAVGRIDYLGIRYGDHGTDGEILTVPFSNSVLIHAIAAICHTVAI